MRGLNQLNERLVCVGYKVTKVFKVAGGNDIQYFDTKNQALAYVEKIGDKTIDNTKNNRGTILTVHF
jgi:hypothetical protein